MSVICFTVADHEQEWVEGAYCPLGGYNHGDSPKIVIWEEYKGLCIRDYERNGYDDSDFFMTVWDPVVKVPFDVIFATTRGWSYPAYNSQPDASPEIMEEYRQYKIKESRRHALKSLCEYRRKMKEISAKYGISYTALRAYERKENMDCFNRAMKLLTTNVRSPFRKSLKDQLVKFITGGSKYNSPFSNKQWQYI